MRITGITTTLYEYALSRPIGDVHLPAGARRHADLAVFVHTDVPEIAGTTIGHPGAAAAIRQLEGHLLGRDPRSVRAIWDTLCSLAFKSGPGGPLYAAIAAIDCALWDIRAKANDVPLWRELGAGAGRVQVYASGLDMPLDDMALQDFYRAMALLGVHAGKLKVGRDTEADERRLDVMAAALSAPGKRPLLMIDANEFWSTKQAIQRIRSLERRFELTWVEEPVPRWNAQSLRRVSDAIRAPVATGENLCAAQQLVPLLTRGAVDVVQIGAGMGGITGALRAAELAAAFDVPVSMCNCPGRYMAHLAAALPHHTMMEVIEAGRNLVLRTQPEIRDGFLILNDTPGAGVEFDAQALERHRVAGASRTTLAAAYARAGDAGQVG